MSKLIKIFFALLIFVLPAAASAATISKAPNNLGLVGYWSFDEGTSTAVADRSGNGNKGTLSGSPAPAWTNGKLGTALSFDGTSSYVSLTDTPALQIANVKTVTFWFKANNMTQTLPRLVSEVQDANNTWTIAMNDVSQAVPNCISVDFKIGGAAHGWNTPANSIVAGQWYRITVTFSGSDVTAIYINGISQTISSNGGLIAGFDSTFNIGRRSDNARWFNGLIDDVRVYSRQLSATEVGSFYNTASAAKVGVGGGVPRLVQHTYIYPPGSGSVAFPGVVTRGNLLVVGISDGATNVRVLNPTVTDTIGNVWTLATTTWTGTYTNQWIYYAISTSSAADTVSVISGSNGLDLGFHISEWSGLGANPLSAVASGRGTTEPTWTTSGATILQNKRNCLLYSIGGSEASGGTITAGSGFTALDLITAQSSFSEYSISNSVGSFAASMVGSNSEWAILLAAFCVNGTNINSSTANLQKGTSLSSGLVGHWTFDGPDVTDKVYDKSGNGNNGYFYNSATSTAKTIGKLGQGLRFDNLKTNYVVIPDHASLDVTTQVTLSAWVKYNKLLDSGIISKDSLNTDTAPYFLDTGCGNTANIISFNTDSVMNSGCGVYSNTTITANKWYHVVGTYDGANLKIYLDGNLDNFAAYVSASIPTNNDSLIIGGYYSTDFVANGVIDDVRVYNRALTAAEVKQLYNLGR